jgi:2-polyprenyl-3-methyl-5-hydroxy-6-metoxy-1,4-benzoquinol methylase
MLRKRVPRRLVRAVQRALFPVPRHLARNHIHLNADAVQRIRSLVESTVFTGGYRPAASMGEVYEYAVKQQLLVRLESDRWLIVPWLDRAKPLKGSRILEIGCGTGPSTVALAEQGAEVVGIDVSADTLTCARHRMGVYGLEAEFREVNANAIGTEFQGQHFDFVIYFATLEHLTVAERLSSLRDAWRLLPVGGLLVIVETPNRLWFYDGHTAKLPFFHWLPDDLAFEYSRFSNRVNFRERFTDYNDPAQREAFLRKGRGVSFHEFDLAIRPAQTLDVVSSLSTFHGMRYKPQRSPFERHFGWLLKHIYPGLHEGFIQDSLNLIIRKDEK